MRRFLAFALLLMGVSLANAQAPTVICLPTSSGSCVPVNGANPLPIAGSFSATLTGFLSNGLFATLTATNVTSASTALPTGATANPSVRITNNGTTVISCTMATGAATGVANNILVQPGSSVSRVVGTFVNIACIDQTGSVSNPVVIEGGSGLGNDSGGGGSGGGGGTVTQGPAGASPWLVSINQGGNTALVKTGNTAAVADQALIVSDANVLAAINAPIPPGTNTIGGVINVGSGLSGNALTSITCGSAVSSCILKASAGNMYGVYAECTAACWLMIFNSTTAPSNGATTAGVASGNMSECISLTGTAGGSKSINYPTFPVAFSVGITAVISSTACASLTLSTVGFIRGTVL